MALIKADYPRIYSKNTHELEPSYGIETVDLLLNMDLQQVPDAAAGTRSGQTLALASCGQPAEALAGGIPPPKVPRK